MRLKAFLELIRIKQWIKNSFVFVPLLFSKHLFDESFFINALFGAIAFCLASSVVYIFNDLIDIEADKLHPKKRLRPLASGAISKSSAILVLTIFASITLLSFFVFDFKFYGIIVLYLLINLFYTLKLKNIVILDILSIAAGFILRVLGGAVIINVSISSWLILSTLFISLFLAIMKRRSEIAALPEESASNSRKVLSDYSVRFTDHLASISASGVIICYALYTVADETLAYFKTENFVYTTIFVVFGIFRFMYLVFMKSKGENATEIMLTDVPMIANILLYVLVMIAMIYWS